MRIQQKKRATLGITLPILLTSMQKDKTAILQGLNEIILTDLQQGIITFSLFHFEGLRLKWWVFREMGLPYPFEQIKGMTFFKKVGTGGGKGFSLFPNFGVYGWLMVWKSAEDAMDFFEHNPIYKEWKDRSTHSVRLCLQKIHAHGTWDKVSPFDVAPYIKPDNHKIAIITRARVKSKFLFQFWRQVPAINRSVFNYPGRQFAMGIGELPLVELATFSIWDNLEMMKSFAYGNEKHQRAIRDTRQLGWYSEELFSRFAIIGQDGQWPGLDLM